MKLPVSLESEIVNLADGYIERHKELLDGANQSRTNRNEILARIELEANQFSKDVKAAINSEAIANRPAAPPYLIVAHCFSEARKSARMLGEIALSLLLWRLEMDWRRKASWRSKGFISRSNACILLVWKATSGYGTSLLRLTLVFLTVWFISSFIVMREQASCTGPTAVLSEFMMFLGRWLYTVFSATIGIGNVDTSSVCSPSVFFVLGFNSLLGLLLVSSIVALVAIRVLVSER